MKTISIEILTFNCSMQILYQQFYKASSTTDRGTHSQLRNSVHRVDVQGSDRVIDSYRKPIGYYIFSITKSRI